MPHKTNITVENGLTIQSRNNFEMTLKNSKFENVMSISLKIEKSKTFF